MDGFADAILVICSLALTAGIGWVGLYVKEHLGLTIEARHREALHQAILSGIEGALSRTSHGHDDEIKAEIVRSAVRHAEKSVPDAIKKLDPRPDVLESIAQAKLAEAVAKQVPPVPTT